MRTATISSLGDGTLDVSGLRTTGGVYRRHFDGTNWSGWRKLGSRRVHLGGRRVGRSGRPGGRC